MSEEQHLQALLDKIHTEGVAKADSDASKIVAAAEAKAKSIVTEAESRAAEHAAKAERDAEAFAQRAAESVRQAARDVVLSVTQAIQEQLEALLLEQTTAALSDPARLTTLIESAVNAYLSGGQKEMTVSLAEKAADIAEALRAAFAKQAATGVTLTLDTNADAGFRIRLENGRVEHDFSAAAISETIAKHLRPKLAELLQKPADPQEPQRADSDDERLKDDDAKKKEKD